MNITDIASHIVSNCYYIYDYVVRTLMVRHVYGIDQGIDMEANDLNTIFPFHGLSDKMFQYVMGNWNRNIQENIDLYDIFENPDKTDTNDPDIMLNIPCSKYYDFQKFNGQLTSTSSKSSLSMLHFNLRSLPKNFDTLHELLCSLNNKPDIIGISETKLNDNSTANTDLIGYKFFHTNSKTAAGGTAIYAKRSLIPVPRKDIVFNMDMVESCWTEFKSSNKKNTIIKGCVYKHPDADVSEFTKQLDNIMKSLNEKGHQVFIMGDINIDFLKYNIHNPTEEYLDMICTNTFLPLITKPTRITDHSATLIDHIYMNTKIDHGKVTSGIATLDITDHLPVFCIVDISVQRYKEARYFRDFSTFNHEAFRNDLNNVNWNEIFAQNENVNVATTKTIEIIEEISNKHAPVRLIPRNKMKLFSKPWITKGIMKSIKTKQKMYKTHFLSNDAKKAQQYKTFSNKLNRIIKQQKKDYYNKKFAMLNNNLKYTWKLIGTLIKRPSKNQETIHEIRKNNKSYTNKIDIANQLNDHFINVGSNLASKIETINESPTSYITNTPACSFVMSPVTIGKTTQLFLNLNENKASIGIPNTMIKKAASELAVPFTLIYNKSIETGVVPDILKISKVTPLFKDDSPNDPNNYRPIATLSSFSKILEKIVHDQLLSFLEKYNILYKYQFGFRKGHSTEQAILEITDNLKANIDKKLITCGLFLDFSKAFDTVNHQILLSKLHAYGIRGTPLKWFTDYLQNRQQYVQIKNVSSEKMTMKCGVPQGSTLGPLLFLLYINDMANSSNKLLFRIFADDTNIFYASKSYNELEKVMNEELKLVLRYCAINKLSVNLKKTNFMVVTNKRKKQIIKISNLECKSYIKYLGVYIDDKLSWSQQIQHVNNKIVKNLGILYKLRHYLNLKMMKQLYYNLIYPFLSYAILSWGNTFKTRLSKIKTKQNKAIKLMFFAHERESARTYYNLLNILDLLAFKTGCFTYQIINQSSNVPQPFSQYVSLASATHNYNTRFATNKNIQRPKARTEYGLQTFTSTASKIWGKIPLHI